MISTSLYRFSSFSSPYTYVCGCLLFYVAWRLTVTVNTAVYLVLAVGQSELLLKLLLAGGDAAGIFALDYARNALGQRKMLALEQLSIADDVDGDAGIYITEHGQSRGR